MNVSTGPIAWVIVSIGPILSSNSLDEEFEHIGGVHLFLVVMRFDPLNGAGSLITS